jgi:hypothetical protein
MVFLISCGDACVTGILLSAEKAAITPQHIAIFAATEELRGKDIVSAQMILMS